jgi:hypothetical protein
MSGAEAVVEVLLGAVEKVTHFQVTEYHKCGLRKI